MRIDHEDSGQHHSGETLATAETTLSVLNDQWWRRAVIYQVYPRSFADSNGDGVGDLRGLISKLDHLTALGVDAVWLCPFYPSPGVDGGYDVSDYCAVDPVLGTLADVDDLILELHRRKMRLIIDIVVNHTSHTHPWFRESGSSRTNPKRDWYWWRKPRPGKDAGAPGAEPTNWDSVFGRSAWTLDERTGEYYLHLFASAQPDLNWECRDVREAVFGMLRWWLDRGVDGFRFDVINLISKPLQLRDGSTTGAADLASGIEAVACGPRVHEFAQELHREVVAPHDRPLLTIGEMPAVTVEEAVLFTDQDRGEFDMVFQFEHMTVDHGAGGRFDVGSHSLPALKQSLARWQVGLADRGWNSLYLSNHDQPRALSRFGSDRSDYRVRAAKLLATVLHLHRGTPFVYQGEELGMTNYPFTRVEEFRDVESLNRYDLETAAGSDAAATLAALALSSRDNARTPMQWDGSDNAGFTTGTPWLPVNPNHREINAAVQRDDPESVFNYFRKLIALRHDEPIVVGGDFTLMAPAHRQLWAFTRSYRDEELLVVANASDDPVDFGDPDLRDWDDARLLLTNLERSQPPSPRDELTPWEARVYKRRRRRPTEV